LALCTSWSISYPYCSALEFLWWSSA